MTQNCKMELIALITDNFYTINNDNRIPSVEDSTLNARTVWLMSNEKSTTSLKESRWTYWFET